MSHFSYSNHRYRSNKLANGNDGESWKKNQGQQQLSQEQKYNQMLLFAQDLIQKEDYEQGITKLRLLMQKINFFKQNKRQYDKKLELVVIYNLAAAYQKQWNLDQCIPLLQKFITLLKNSLQESLKASGTLNLQENNKHWFKMKTILIKALLQYCAVLSQIGQHKKALKVATETTAQLKQLFKRGFDDCNKMIAKKQSFQEKKGNVSKNNVNKFGPDKVQFSYSVLLDAREILQDLSYTRTYTEINEGNYAQVQMEMRDVKSKLFFWKSNPQNNIKMLRQSFHAIQAVQEQKKANSQRNLLGIKRNQGWIQQFTIAKIMYMTSINYLQFTDPDNLIFEFNHRNIIQKIILLSVTYFSLSIELRFLEQEKPQQKQSKNNFLQVQGKRQEPSLQKSQIFHLKSIQTVCKHVKENSAFLNHLVINYQKHYINNLNTIQQENSIAEYSQLYDIRKLSRNSSSLQTGQMIIPIQSNRPSLRPDEQPNHYRKDSIYYTEKEDEQLVPPLTEKIQDTVFGFKKLGKKKLEEAQEKSERSKKLGNSTSFSRFQLQRTTQKDKTMKKMSSSKVITLGKLNDIHITITDRSQKQISSKHMSARSIDKKNLSKSKNFLKNSITLKQNKSHSPQKERQSKAKVRDLKQSGDFSKRDFVKKKSPQPSRALDLLKKSGSLHDIQLKSSKDLGQARNQYSSPNTLQIKRKG